MWGAMERCHLLELESNYTGANRGNAGHGGRLSCRRREASGILSSHSEHVHEVAI